MAAVDAEKTEAAVNSDANEEAKSTADKPETVPATENDEKAIDEKKPEATSDGIHPAEADPAPKIQQNAETNEQ